MARRVIAPPHHFAQMHGESVSFFECARTTKQQLKINSENKRDDLCDVVLSHDTHQTPDMLHLLKHQYPDTRLPHSASSPLNVRVPQRSACINVMTREARFGRNVVRPGVQVRSDVNRSDLQ